jgi:signal transduction histidine kinase
MSPRRAGARGLRSAADSVLLHDMKNVGQRLNLLLSNLDEHYGDPDFKRSVSDLLQSTVQKIDAVLTHWAASREAVLIKVPIDPAEVLREVVATPRQRTGSADVRVLAELGEVPRVWGDPYFLAEAFQNVFQNALEAAASVVTVRAFTGRTPRHPAVVEIEDDGPGMTAEFLATDLFRPFRTTKPDGVGLGLYTARQVFGLHGGRIDVESAPGAGTRIRVTLPGAESGPRLPGRRR